MPISVTPLSANTVNGSFSGASPWVAGSGVTLGVGDVVVFVNGDSFTPTPTGVQVDTVTATQLGVTSSGFGTAWIAQGVNAATGNISISFGSGYNLVSANWFLITGEDVATKIFTSNSNQSFNSSEPQPVSGTIPAGGVGLLAIGINAAGVNKNPTTWAGCVTSGNTTLESYLGTGNSVGIAGNYATTAGSGPFSASSGSSYSGTNTEIMMVTFAAAGGGGGGGGVPSNVLGLATSEW